MERQELFDIDPYLSETTAEVLSCRPGKKKDYEIILDRSIFFPEAGGQACDRGCLISGGGMEIEVLSVEKREGELLHYTKKPLEAGSQVICKIDWKRRYELMQNHTGEHIISGLIHTLYGYENVGFHLSDRTMTADYDGPIPLESISVLEDQVNRLIWNNTPVQVTYPSQEELKHMLYRSKKELEGQVRIVTIEGCDACACCATHVRRTGEVGILKILAAQSYKGGSRLSLACGARALRDYQSRQKDMENLSALLNAPQNKLPEALLLLQEENALLKQALLDASDRILENDLAGLDKETGPVCLFVEHVDQNKLRKAVNKLVEKHKGYCAIFQGSEERGYSFVIGSKSKDCQLLLKFMRDKFACKGGGQSTMVQGSIQAAKEEITGFFHLLD